MKNCTDKTILIVITTPSNQWKEGNNCQGEGGRVEIAAISVKFDVGFLIRFHEPTKLCDLCLALYFSKTFLLSGSSYNKSYGTVASEVVCNDL